MTQLAGEAVPRTIAESLDVLVVDDDEDARAVVAMAVRGLGHSCRVARDGLEAFEMHTLDKADVILSDWAMPRMNGLELCLKIRAGEPARAFTHFIFCTGKSDKAHSLEGMRAGADDYLVKPIDIDQLETRLVVARRALMLHRELRASHASVTPPQ
jgi:sigma-B regulation protein RsbU (phosphoserine phosphatase)